ncbi:hypothetical protein WJX73_002239 [Symbiochloris irregularis]|uniref:C2H2-type domain-containing protein n=1 Tax=Symbiochloris irregularis TaxID=706552 RepID=A0AAW1P2T2_9CHLO
MAAERGSPAWSDDERVADDDSERFHCPFPDCKRSFAELWRLKVHYRAPPDIRGSGKERGHSMELTSCPKCRKELKPGKHHTGCRSSTRTGPAQAKRTKQNRAKRAAAEAAYEQAVRVSRSGSRTRSVDAKHLQRPSREGDPQAEPDEARRSSAPAHVGRALDEAIELAVPALQRCSPGPECAPDHATIPAYGSAGRSGSASRSGEGVGFQRVGRKHALECTPSHETCRAPRDQHGNAQHKQGKLGSGGFDEPRYLRNQRAAAALPKIPIQTSLSRERIFRRSNAWLKAFSDAAAGGGSWNGSEGRVSMTKDMDGADDLDAAPNQRFLSCPLPGTELEHPIHPLDGPYDPTASRAPQMSPHPPPGFHQPLQGALGPSGLPPLGLGSAFVSATRQQQRDWDGSGEMGPGVKPDPGQFNPFMEVQRGNGNPFAGGYAEQDGQPALLGAQYAFPLQQMSLMASLVSLPSLPDGGLGAGHSPNGSIQDLAPGSVNNIANPFASARIPELPLDRSMQLPQHQDMEQEPRMLPQNPTPQQQMTIQNQLQQYAAMSLGAHGLNERQGSGENTRWGGPGIPQFSSIPRGPMPFGMPFNNVNSCSMSSLTSAALDMAPALMQASK